MSLFYDNSPEAQAIRAANAARVARFAAMSDDELLAYDLNDDDQAERQDCFAELGRRTHIPTRNVMYGIEWPRNMAEAAKWIADGQEE
ncbi:MAG TPA: hypothetical protein PKN52_11160 [Trueperaceae bacterium]|nr:hypothetical protein [Trueperaceae bacterium]